MDKRLVLMYHALYEDEASWRALSAQERPYAVSTESFKEQMILLQKHCRIIRADEHDQPPNSEKLEVLLTFDDGHLSNARLAAPLLSEFGFTAIFFVTSDFIENDEQFCNWSHLATMASEGHVIGAHGASHRFFSEMDVATQRQEFEAPKDLAKRQVGLHLNTLSFPGGRYSGASLKLAEHIGYQTMYGSRFDVQVLGNRAPLPRVAIRHSTSLEEFENIVTLNTSYYLKKKGGDALKRWAKRCIGDSQYDKLYQAAAYVTQRQNR